MLRVSLVALLVCGCYGRSVDRGIEVNTTDIIEDQQELIDYITDDIVHRSGADLSGLATHVAWTTTPCPEVPDLTAVVYRGECYHGLTFGCHEMFVAMRSGITESAFGHELGHCIRLHLGLDGDAAHEKEWWWQKMDRLNAEFAELTNAPGTPFVTHDCGTL